MSDVRDDFYPDEFYSTETCESCGKPVSRDEAFKEGRKYYHPDCAGVSQCQECGTWLEKGRTCCICGEVPSRRYRRDGLAVLTGLALILAFTLGLVLGVKVEQADQKLVAREAAAEVSR